jgi:hypothetical protein
VLARDINRPLGLRHGRLMMTDDDDDDDMKILHGDK